MDMRIIPLPLVILFYFCKNFKKLTNGFTFRSPDNNDLNDHFQRVPDVEVEAMVQQNPAAWKQSSTYKRLKKFLNNKNNQINFANCNP